MAEKKPRKKRAKKTEKATPRACAFRPVPKVEMPASMNPGRARLILRHRRAWTNGTVLRYYLFRRASSGPGRKWGGTAADHKVVRRAFKAWKEVGIGLDFREVSDREDAEVRIGFYRGSDPDDGGNWSLVGRDVVDYEKNPDRATMNLAENLATDYVWDTALHEIGHTLGFPHEHQNPNAGIEWDREAVYDYFAAYPNFWSRATTDHNILNTIDPAEVKGTNWDKDSIMHYEFAAGLIRTPPFDTEGLVPAPGLSQTDKDAAKSFYPPMPGSAPARLHPFESRKLDASFGGQVNFTIKPDVTRTYKLQTLGPADAVMTLFEHGDDHPFFIGGDDDGGEDRNAAIETRLYRGRTYVLRIRLYFVEHGHEAAVIMT